MDYIQALILGVTQGIAEWIPISSEGLTAILAVNFFEGITATEIIRISLYLHIGTFLAALIYFRKDLWSLILKTLNYTKESKGTRNIINFYVVATLVSGGLGYLILQGIAGLEDITDFNGKTIIIILGFLLLVTGVLQLRSKSGGEREAKDINMVDAVLAGLAQGFAALPGLSRSGLTVSTLLLRNVDENESLKMSFIMSLPIVLMGNIFLQSKNFIFTPESLLALLFSFVFGLLTIHLLLRAAKKIEFGWFVILFALLVFASAYVIS